ncbi:MAG: glucosamine-6-phosphate deaminase [Arachidicoccus sp.]|nr:glucosamine-6-phosphate deaminase [Arachidicoccus sp.]
MNLSDSFEKIPVQIFKSPSEGSISTAHEIAALIKEKQSRNENCVLGLATGSTPIKVYDELVRLHKEDGLSFKNVITFNLDEYYPIVKDSPNSYWYFMHKHLFNHVDINPENIHIPNGEWKKENIRKRCEEYENEIEAAGGIDLQLLGIGGNGHIGFNEPGSSLLSKTRLLVLENSTRIANSRDFLNLNQVPKLAVSMGLSTILKAKKIVLLAWGNKAQIVAKAVEGNITDQIPASYLQQHNDCTFVLDEIAASELNAF